MLVQQVARVMRKFYPDFREAQFDERCEHFHIPKNKKIKEFSTGMKARLKVLLAVSHDSELLLLDEPTAGLDVMAREEILDLLREYMEIPGRSIVISSHISGDLEHFCDDLYMIHEGKIVLHEETDRILEEYGFLKMSEQEYKELDKEYLLRVRKESFGYSTLTNQRAYYLENYPMIVNEKGSVDELLLSTGIIFCCAVLWLALMLPLRLKYGDRERILMAGLAVVILMFILLCDEILKRLNIGGNAIDAFFNRNTFGIGAGLVFVCLVCLLVSVKCSERVMERMEEF